MAAYVAIVAQKDAATFRKRLKQCGWSDDCYVTQKVDNRRVAVPINQEFISRFASDSNDHFFENFEFCLSRINLQEKPSRQRVRDKLVSAVKSLCVSRSLWRNDLESDLPLTWEKHGDLLLLPSSCFTLDVWKLLGEELWQVVATAVTCSRVAQKLAAIAADEFRSPSVSLLLGDNSWVQHVDNGIRYSFDMRRCMFSAGNITEKLRVANFDCRGEVVVDLYAGIGYFTLPYLVHAGAAHLYACEWNPDAIEALTRNLELNGVSDRCTVLSGDNRQTCPRNIADRVNLGLIPSSEAGWLTACTALKPDTGGVLHVHGTVTSGKVCQLKTDDEEPTTVGNEEHSGVETRDSRICLETERVTGSHSSAPDVDEEHCGSGVNQSRTSCCETERTSSSRCLSADRSNCTSLDSSHLTVKIAGDTMKFAKSCRCKREWSEWAESVCQTLGYHLRQLGRRDWSVSLQHIEHVKSYAPRVDHVVADIEFRPASS